MGIAEDVLADLKSGIDKTLEDLKHDLSKVRTGRANPAILEGVRVEYYGAQTPLNGVANINVADARLVTPDGAVITEIEADQLELLRKDAVFALHEKNGFLKISEHAQDGEAAASDMASRDQSAPLTDADFEEGKAPVAGKAAPEAPKPTAKPHKA